MTRIAASKFSQSLFCRIGMFFWAALFLVGCQEVSQKPIGENLSGAFSLARIGSSTDLLVLNSSSNGEFKDGSLARYSVEPQGKLSLKSTLSIPRLGFSTAVSADGKFAAVSFVGKESRLRFYNLDDDKVLESSLSEIELPSEVIFENLRFFTPTQAQSGDYFLFGKLTSGKVLVFQLNSTSAQKILTLPDDMPGKKVEYYKIALGAPVYVESDDLLVAFPIQTSDEVRPTDKDGVVVSPHKIAVGEWDPLENPSGDIRGLSMLVIDFNKFLSEKSLRNASAYVPFIHRDDYKLPAASEPPEAGKASDTARFRRSFQNATFLNSGGCFTRNSVTGIAADTVVLSEDPSDGYSGPRGQMLGLKNWSALKTKISALENFQDDASFDYNKRLIFENVDLSLFSDAVGLAVSNSRTTPIEILENDSKCLPVWGRIETGNTLGGMEKMTLVAQTGTDPLARTESSNQLLNRGTMGIASVNEFLFTSSYSFDVIKTILFDNNSFVSAP